MLTTDWMPKVRPTWCPVVVLSLTLGCVSPPVPWYESPASCIATSVKQYESTSIVRCSDGRSIVL
jgi:hypothetical protein